MVRMEFVIVPAHRAFTALEGDIRVLERRNFRYSYSSQRIFMFNLQQSKFTFSSAMINYFPFYL